MFRSFTAVRSSIRLISPREFVGHPLRRCFASQQQPRPAESEQEPLDVLRARLLYQSKKRGILENDIIIGGFAAKHLPELTYDELCDYDRIINGGHMEWDLYYYFVGRKEAPPEMQNCEVFKKLQDFANNSLSQKPKCSMKTLLLAMEAKVSKLFPALMKNQLAKIHELITKEVEFDDQKYRDKLKGSMDLHIHLAKIRIYFRWKSPYNKLQLLGTAVYEDAGLITVLYRLTTLKSGLLTTYNPIYFWLQRDSNQRLIEGALDLYVNDEGLISKIVHRDATFQDIEAAKAFSEAKQESEEEFRKRFEEQHKPLDDALSWRNLFKRPTKAEKSD